VQLTWPAPLPAHGAVRLRPFRDSDLPLIDFAWTLPDLHRVELYIEEWNIGSLRVAAGAGFTHEGVLRSHQEIGGTRRDMLLFAAVRGER
jgi:ribosomal-protein-alanine N-acetyltransferase